MRGFLPVLSLALGIAAAALPLHLEAADNGRAVLAWDAVGRVFQVGTQTVLFLGSMEGVIYVENTKSEFDQGFAQCPFNQQLDVSTGRTNGTGHCMITESSDTIFADLTCEGALGGCEGKFKITGGTGRFKGVSGSSSMTVRSPMHRLATGLGSGSLIRVRSGVMLLRDLKVNMPRH